MSCAPPRRYCARPTTPAWFAPQGRPPCRWVARLLLHRDRAVVGGAALALGGSRLPEALAPLREAQSSTADRQLMRTIVDASALQRSEAAAEALVATGEAELAITAARGLRLHRDRGGLGAMIEAAVAGRRDPRVSRAWRDGDAVSG